MFFNVALNHFSFPTCFQIIMKITLSAIGNSGTDVQSCRGLSDLELCIDFEWRSNPAGDFYNHLEDSLGCLGYVLRLRRLNCW